MLKFWTPVNTVKSPESELFICKEAGTSVVSPEMGTRDLDTGISLPVLQLWMAPLTAALTQ